MSYDPRPIDPSTIPLPDWLTFLLETLARHNHDVWARRRLDEGWRWGPARSDVEKTHPDLVPFEHLSEAEREYDYNAARATLQLLLALGLEIRPRNA